MKRVLITGEHSFIGLNLKTRLGISPDDYSVSSVSLRDNDWKNTNLSEFDTIVHVAGIAHNSSDRNLKELYYSVNRDLTFEVAKCALEAGVKHFIFLSSIIFFGEGESGKFIIDEKTLPNPKNFYGDSKLQAEKLLDKLQTDTFNIAIVRPPMVYGRGSKGNYPRLANLARKMPLFPDYHNARSMIYIENLCEFLKHLIDEKSSGYFHPQNEEYVSTSELVATISEVNGKNIRLISLGSRVIDYFVPRVDLFGKVFGSAVYDKALSEHPKDYWLYSLRDSIERTELGYD